MKEKIKAYASFLLDRCLSIKKGEPLAISYDSYDKDFVDIVLEVAKEKGITDIYLMEFDQAKAKEILENFSIEEIKKHPYFDRSIEKEVYDKKGSILFPLSYGGKSLLSDVDKEKMKAMRYAQATTKQDAYKARGKYDFPWCIAAVASKPWADELFPNEENNLEKLWNLIFDITFMNEKNPLEAWERQISKNTEIKNILTDLKLTKLKYKNDIGTDIEIGLPTDVIWWGAAKKSMDGKKDLIVNVPTLEVFTAPNKDKVNGTVVSSKPLVLSSTIIDKLKLTFKDGKVTDAWASNDEETLINMIKEFEGMDALGEVAFVDYDSAISNTNMVFKSTLIDENASCHLALGTGNVKSIPGGETMTNEELLKRGINRSNNHIDFMIGTSDLSIIGTDIYGNEIPLFVDGNFALDKVKSFLKERNDK